MSAGRSRKQPYQASAWKVDEENIKRSKPALDLFCTAIITKATR
jgi:hypothetical protein